jgi:hypothetical protein
MKLIDLRALMEQNPNLDATKMQEGLATAERLRQLGFKRASYSLASPYSRAEAARERQGQVRNKANR